MKYKFIPTTGRGVLVVHAIEKSTKQKWCFMTAHLESMKDYGVNRMKQFGEMIKLAHANDQYKVVFGGDFNMRDAELNKFIRDFELKQFYNENIRDLWDGSNETKFTWDLRK